MNDSRPRMTPGPDHPITVEPSTDRIVVSHGDQIIARTDRALELREAAYPPVFYIPRVDVDPDVLRPSDHHTYCPFKGEASYFDLTVDDKTDLTGSVWYYDDPFPAVADIKDHVAFYADRVDVTATPGPGTVE